MLLGADPDQAGRLRVYVGESDDAVGRQDAHAREKDFWDTAVVFVSSGERLTKAHVRWLEAKLLGEIATARRASLENGQLPSDRALPEADTAEMTEFLEQIILVAEVLGIDVFPVSQWRSRHRAASDTETPASVAAEALVFRLDGRTYNATLQVTEDGFVVQRESTAVGGEARDSLQAGYAQLRTQLIGDGVMVPAGDGYRFSQDYAFKSPSAAAGVVTATNRSGRATWKLEDGRTLGEWEDAQTSEPDGSTLTQAPP